MISDCESLERERSEWLIRIYDNKSGINKDWAWRTDVFLSLSFINEMTSQDGERRSRSFFYSTCTLEGCDFRSVKYETCSKQVLQAIAKALRKALEVLNNE